MNQSTFGLMQDQQIRRYYLFLLSLSFFLLSIALLFCNQLTNSAKTMLLQHDEAITASLIAQGIPETIIARALTETDVTFNKTITQSTTALLEKIGIRPTPENQFLPHLYHFRQVSIRSALAINILFCLLLLSVSLLFLYRRTSLYQHATSIINNYTKGHFSSRLPQTDEGALHQMLSAVDRLATMLQAQKDAEHQSKLFLRNTISDISHQLKTPLAALSMYQEIMENEPDQPNVIQHFATKTGFALKRMEQLVQSMLKITRLDAGNIVFEKQRCNLRELIGCAVSELTTRAEQEGKTILFDGSATETVLCDMTWTCEAIGNLVKNALDHTRAQDSIHITWENTPFHTVIQISDSGDGIAPEDIYHIFKRFYRSNPSANTLGIGLGLPLAKSIIEGQGGTISVQSTLHVGTCFSILFPQEADFPNTH